MIKSYKGTVTIEGTGEEIMADFSVATQALMETLMENGSKEEAAEGLILHTVKEGIRHASSDYEESPTEKKIRELIEEIMKSRVEEDVDRKRS